ncbi:hypothetical protein IGB42_04054 [Andreprevotia sp. IGB-42]|uniref:hypothetical protein n=1 Tax=Andreprevotia sp. IGB-42 TaxID=2497473 RepID=UPI001356F880|nr:hypothetical protein [Andreprevotia sp. IGB-42]KAF0811436.1 hypothetical protein IGB42_04054 [Andreprevotia sp. IGB-42]
MAGLSLSTRLALFFYGMPNIVGSLCALVVLALYFGGVIAAWWFPLTVAAYVFGWLATPTRGRFEASLIERMSLIDALDALLASAGSKLPAEATTLLAAIRSKVVDLLPRLDEAGFPTQARIELGNAIRRDLPHTVANYVALPSGFASLHPVRAGKTARQLLIEQLALLDSEIGSIANDVFGEDADKLAAHGDYLRGKFQPVNFLES